MVRTERPTPSTSCGSPAAACAASPPWSGRCWTVPPRTRSATCAGWGRSSRRPRRRGRPRPPAGRRRDGAGGAGARPGRGAAATDGAAGDAGGAGTGGRDAASPRYYQLLDDLHALLADPPLIGPASGPARPVLRKAVRRAGRRLRRQLRTATRPRRPSVRPRCTRCARPPSGFGTPRAGLGVLGRRAEARHGDGGGAGRPRGGAGHVRHAGALPAAGDRGGDGGENAWTYGRLHGLEQARAERAERAFWDLAPSLPR